MDCIKFSLILLLNILKISSCYGMCDQRPFGGEMKCCDGKNSNCFVKIHTDRGPRHTNKICYCDSYCKFTKDCCEDYDKVYALCKERRDCKVSNWKKWSSCSTKCGFGTMERKRTVLQTAQNGGKECPPLIQVRGCYLNNICAEKKYETAFILPISYRRPAFGKWGYENILPAVKNVNNDISLQNDVSGPTNSYCVHFKFIFKRNSCKGSWAEQLRKSLPICTECQSRVMDGGHCRGEGAEGVKTRWTALGINRCQGDWIRVGPVIPNCACSEKQYTNFVFV